MFFHVLTKNLNWQSLTKNLVTFILIIVKVHCKIRFFREEGVHELIGGGMDNLQTSGGRGPEKKEGLLSSPIWKTWYMS